MVKYHLTLEANELALIVEALKLSQQDHVNQTDGGCWDSVADAKQDFLRRLISRLEKLNGA